MTPPHTHIHQGEEIHSVIDLAITTPDIAPLFTQHVVDDSLFSDHFPIHYQHNVPSGQPNFYSIPRWNFKKADWAQFQNHISESLALPPPQTLTQERPTGHFCPTVSLCSAGDPQRATVEPSFNSGRYKSRKIQQNVLE